MIKLSKEENFKNLVEASIEKFGDIFDFDINEYITKNNVTIRCKNGHVLNRTHKNHLKSKGCHLCIPRMDREQFIQKSKEIHGNKFNYDLVVFTGVNKKVHLVCNDCGENIFQTVSNNLMGNGCVNCAGKKQHTKESYIKLAVEKHGDLYGYDEVNYTNLKVKIKIWCKACQKYFYQRAIGHLYSGCLTCGGRELLTQEEFILRAKEANGEDKYDYSNVKYVNMNTKVELKCLRCERVFEIDPGHHVHRKQGCSVCEFNTRFERRLSRREKYIQRCIDRHGDKYDYSLVPEDIKVSDNITIYCKKCDRHFTQNFNVHSRSVVGCTRCARTEKITYEEFVRRATETHGDRYDYSESVVAGVDTKTVIICKRCKKRFKVTLHEHTANAAGCSHCNKSRGEMRVSRVLDKLGVDYEPQKKFSDCKNLLPLPFDFAILDNDSNVKGLIEMQGEQHYRPVCFGGISMEKAEEILKRTQLSDSIKKEYCQKNGIPLLEINHNDYKNTTFIVTQFVYSLDDLVESL